MYYFFDGTKEGFLTAFTLAFSDPNAFLTSSQAQLSLGEELKKVETDFSLSQRAENRLLSFDRDCMWDLDRLLRCGMPDSEQVAFLYFRFLATEKRPVGKRLHIPEVFRAVEYIKKVGFEIHRFHGFIRFMQTESGALYAPFSPDNDICDLLIPHFRARMPKQPFALHDVKRKKIAVYDGKNAFIAPLPHAEVFLSADEQSWQSLWKEYYRSVNIPSRAREKQMRGYLPVRYWDFLPERQETPISIFDDTK